MIEKAAAVLKALGEPTRLKIVKFLSLQELCICELTAILDMSQPRVSQHVRVLKQAGLLKERKVKQKSYFSLNKASLNGSDISAFKALISSYPDAIPELRDEMCRFSELDNNEDVIACKEDCMVKIKEIKQII